METIHEYCMILEQRSFYEGHSQHPVHQLLKIPIYILRIGQLIATQEQIQFAMNPHQKQFIVFTENQIKLFHVLQIIASNYITKMKLMIPIPSQRVELTPNLILPISYPSDDNNEQQTVDNNSAGNPNNTTPITMTTSRNSIGKSLEVEERNNKKKKKKKEPSKEHQPITAAEGIANDNQAAVGSPLIVQSSSNPTMSSSLIEECLSRPDCKNLSLSASRFRYYAEAAMTAADDSLTVFSSLLGVCKEYEQIIEGMRDKYESINQATNLKLYIKEIQVENLEERLRHYEAI